MKKSSDEEKYCTSCGVSVISKQPHNIHCEKYKKQWEFIFHKGSKNERIETYYGNTEEQAKQDMLRFYQKAVKEAEQNGIEFSMLFDGLEEMKETGEVVNIGQVRM